MLTDAEMEAVRLSLSIALRSVLFSLPLAVAVAWLLTRRALRGRLFLDALVHLPLVLPPVVVGYLLLLLFGMRGPIGGWLYEHFGVQLVFTSAGAALATAVMSFPLMVRAIRISLEGIDPGLEDAARTLGAGPWDRFFTVTLPLMLPGILAGAQRGHGVCRRARRVRCGHHVRVQHSRRDAHVAVGPLHSVADARGRRDGGATGGDFLFARAARLDHGRIHRATRAAHVGQVTERMFSIRAKKRRDGFALDVAIDVSAPGVVALFGRSGCGKTTLVNIVAGLLRADEAHVEIDGVTLEGAGKYLPAEQRRIGYVFQDARLFPHLDVMSNLRYGEKRARDGERRITLDLVAPMLGLEPLLSRRVHQLSGGERQRIALGRALLSQPRLLLLDEPLASLDAARREEVLPYLEKLRDELAIPIIYVSHQFEEVLRLATHVVLMDRGKVLSQGSLDDLSLHPELRAIVGLDGVGAVLRGAVESVDGGIGLASVRIGNNVLQLNLRAARAGSAVRIQLLARDIILATSRPENLSVRNVLTGTVARIVADDEDTDLVYVDIGGASVLARVTRAASMALALRTGTPVWVLVKTVSIRGHAFLSHEER
jgi:molybdate transport system ATP-binding protein